MRDPLIHIGYHKTGSSWLQEKVFADPATGFTKQTTPLAIDEAFVARGPFDFDATHARAALSDVFDDAMTNDRVPVISHERLSGDIGTGGIDARIIADRLAESFPSGRVLIVVREQVEMALSVYKTEVRHETFTIEQRFRDRTVLERRHPSPSLDYFAYHRLIAYYQKLFGMERVLVLPFEQLRTDATGFLDRITSFVELPSVGSAPADQVNTSPPAALLAAMRYVNYLLFAPGMRRFFAGPLEERKAMRGVRKVVNGVGSLVPGAPSRWVERRWRDTIRELAGDRFALSNAITSEITGIDLAALGYMT